jgi:hypothetical protein
MCKAMLFDCIFGEFVATSVDDGTDLTEKASQATVRRRLALKIRALALNIFAAIVYK